MFRIGYAAWTTNAGMRGMYYMHLQYAVDLSNNSLNTNGDAYQKDVKVIGRNHGAGSETGRPSRYSLGLEPLTAFATAHDGLHE